MGQESPPQLGKDYLTPAQACQYIAKESMAKQDWSGLPFPVLGLKLVLEPRYKHKDLENFQWDEYCDEDGTRHQVEKEPPPEPSEYRVVNSWWNANYGVTFYIFQNAAGRAHVRISLEDRLSFTMRTLEAAVAWPLEAEQKAQKKLATLIPEHAFEMYMLTGHFYEKSERSKLVYVFRRCRPTIVLREVEGNAYGLCALCLHPIGYYAQSWAGVMCPTDEVIAHLLMMRGSEHKYWANANQHSLDHPNSGV